ncbi:MAG: DNA helicase [Ignavibacteria bacterium]|nr:MAG: DNA helicase [Ignavibacteria bacterium]
MKLLENLNEAQREAVEYNKTPHMIVAGAGSGKTRVLTYKIAYVLKEKMCEPENILALTFTNKAANEMKERIIELVGKKASKIWMGTFHSIFARILRAESEKLDYRPNFSIYDREDSISLVNNIITALNLNIDLSPSAIHHKISHFKNHMISVDEYIEHIAKTSLDRKIGEIYKEYEIRIKENNSMDFDDLLLKPIELFNKYPRVLQHYRGQFKYILVDEFQDTNHAQYELIQMLYNRLVKICVVGDDAQSIYGWRGADIGNMLNFEKDFPKTKIFRLEQNYRSTKTILKAADSLIKNNKDQIQKTLWTDNPDGDKISLMRCSDEKDEAFQIARRIKKEITSRKLKLSDVAILYRINAQSRALEEALRREKLPYKIIGGVEFYRRKEIKDIVGYLRVLANQDDEESLLRIMNFPQRGIGNTSITKMIEFARRLNLTLFQTMGRIFEVIEVKERIQKNVKGFKQFLDKYISLKDELSLSELTSAMVDELGILRMYKEENSAESMQRYANIQELLRSIQEFTENNKKATIDDYLAEVSLISGIDQFSESDAVIPLMTVHSAKGLEFPVVFLTGCEEDIFPLNPKFDEDARLEEERRLFYVALTRAKEKVIITYARSRYRFGEVAYQARSRFIEELDPETVDEVEGIGKGRSRRKRKSYYDEFYQEGFDEDYNQERRSLRVGSRVVHELFGQGKILAINGQGDMQKVSVDFEEHGTKHLLVKFANLRLI